MWGQLIGAGIGALGSMFGGGSSAPKFKPWDINMPGVGSVDFDWKNKSASASMDPKTTEMMNFLYGQGMNQNYGAGMAQFGQGMAGMMPGLFSEAQAASFLDPRMINQFNRSMGGAQGQLQGGINSMFGFGNAAMNGQLPGQAQAGQMFGSGMGMVGERPGQSYQDVAQGRVDLLRQQARPYEQRAQNDMFQKLQKMGQMGMPAGGRAMENFGLGLGQADLARQMEGQNLAESLYGRDQQYALGRNQIGAGMAGQGMGGMFQGAGMGLDAFRAGTNAIPNLANMANMQYSGNMMFSDAVNARAQQRMGNAVNMFGFGQDAQSNDLRNALAAMGGYGAFQQGATDLLKTGAQMGQANAQAAGQYGQQPNPWGQLAQGVGYGMMNGSFGNMFSQPGQFGYQSQPIYGGGGIPMIGQPTGPINVYGPSGGIKFGNLI